MLLCSIIGGNADAMRKSWVLALLQGMSRGVYGGFAPCMVNTVTTVGLGFWSYEIGCDLFRTHILDTPRSPTPGEPVYGHQPVSPSFANGASQHLYVTILAATLAAALAPAAAHLHIVPVRNGRQSIKSCCAGERGVIAGCSAIGVMTATMPLEVVTRRMQASPCKCIGSA